MLSAALGADAVLGLSCSIAAGRAGEQPLCKNPPGKTLPLPWCACRLDTLESSVPQPIADAVRRALAAQVRGGGQAPAMPPAGTLCSSLAIGGLRRLPHHLGQLQGPTPAPLPLGTRGLNLQLDCSSVLR